MSASRTARATPTLASTSLVLALATAPAAEPELTSGPVLRSNVAGMAAEREDFYGFALPAKPARFDSWRDRIDFIHQQVQPTLEGYVAKADSFFAEDCSAAVCSDRSEYESSSKFRMGMYAEITARRGLSLSVDPDFEADISLPNIEHRWKVFLDNKANNELPSTAPSERDGSANIGIRRRHVRISTGAGLKIRWPPVLFVKSEWGPRWDLGCWAVLPGQRVYYETDDGFGEVTSIKFRRWLGQSHGSVAEIVSGARWTEVSRGLEWDQFFKITWLPALIDESQRGKSASDDDVAHGFGFRFGFSGARTISTRYKVTLLYRRPLYRKWMFLEVDPEVNWARANDWKPEFVLRVGIDALFWGTAER